MQQTTSYRVTWLIRRLFRGMGRNANDALQDLGITAADRAVLEFLYPDERLAVPEIAERYDVSRQHIQVTVNGLVDKGLLRTRRNPRHKRSPLLELTPAGRRLFASVLENDLERIEALFADLPHADLETTASTLARLLERLDKETKP